MMRLLNKKGLAAVLAVATLGTLIALPTIGSDSEHKDITLASIEASILANNKDIKVAELEVELQEEEVREAKDDKQRALGTGLESDMATRYNKRLAEMNLYIAEQDLDDLKESQVLTGIEKYFETLVVTKEIDNQNQTILRLGEELAAVEKRIELGTAVSKDKLSKELEIKEAEYTLMTLQDDKKELYLDLNLLMMQPVATTLVEADAEIPYEVFTTEDIEADIVRLLETDEDLWKLEKQKDLDEIEVDILDKYNSSDKYDDEIDTLEASIEQADLEIADKKLNLEYTVRSQYNALLSSADTVTVRELELENLQLTLETVNKRFEVGFETLNTVKVAQENVAAAELALMNAKLDYYVAVETYKNLVD